MSIEMFGAVVAGLFIVLLLVSVLLPQLDERRSNDGDGE